MLVNSGSGEFSVGLAPEESVCDGGWHTITSELKTQTITLHTYTLVIFVFVLFGNQRHLNLISLLTISLLALLTLLGSCCLFIWF